MNTPSVVKSSPLWRPASRGIIVTLIAGLAILALGRGGEFAGQRGLP
ncbi:hypothetical protein QE371_002913 [Klebsiella variicola]|nr:hypothetical protein [Klebsiella variicola]